MLFPLFIYNRITINLSDVNITSEKYLINIIDSILENKGMGNWRKTEKSIFAHKNDLMFRFRTKDLINNIWIKVKIKNGKIKITLLSITILMFIFASIISIFILFDNPEQPNYEYAIYVFLFLFGFNYIIRLIAHHDIKKEIENKIRNL